MEDQQPDPDDLMARNSDENTLNVADDSQAAAAGVRSRPRRPGRRPHGKQQWRVGTLEVDAAADTVDKDLRADDAQDVDAIAADEDNGNSGTARRRFSRWHTVMVGVAAVVFVGSATFAGSALHAYLADRASTATRTEVVRIAVAAVTTLWTYTPETIDTLADRASEYLSGDFNAQYRKFLDAAAAPNKQAQVTDSTEVVGAGVESLNGTDATVIVFTNTTATSPLTRNVPSLKYVGYRLTMQREGSRWLVTNMSTVSFMDLTPQI